MSKHFIPKNILKKYIILNISFCKKSTSRKLLNKISSYYYRKWRRLMILNKYKKYWDSRLVLKNLIKYWNCRPTHTPLTLTIITARCRILKKHKKHWNCRPLIPLDALTITTEIQQYPNNVKKHKILAIPENSKKHRNCLPTNPPPTQTRSLLLPKCNNTPKT
jgi:hypothetical protein